MLATGERVLTFTQGLLTGKTVRRVRRRMRKMIVKPVLRRGRRRMRMRVMRRTVKRAWKRSLMLQSLKLWWLLTRPWRKGDAREIQQLRVAAGVQPRAALGATLSRRTQLIPLDVPHDDTALQATPGVGLGVRRRW